LRSLQVQVSQEEQENPISKMATVANKHAGNDKATQSRYLKCKIK